MKLSFTWYKRIIIFLCEGGYISDEKESQQMEWQTNFMHGVVWTLNVFGFADIDINQVSKYLQTKIAKQVERDILSRRLL